MITFWLKKLGELFAPPHENKRKNENGKPKWVSPGPIDEFALRFSTFSYLMAQIENRLIT